MDSDMNLDRCYEVVLRLVHQAGEIIAERNSGSKTVTEKASNIDLVTETDQQVERLLIDGLLHEFPSHKFIGEEESSEEKKPKLTDDPTWIIDPVDGTMNFVHSFPHSAISIALLIEKTTQIAIIFNPILNQMFTARKDQGAFYNGKQVHVSNQTNLAAALITTEFGTSRDPERTTIVLENIGKIMRKAHGIRTVGSCALNMAMVAIGAADAMYEYGIHAWDIAAADLLIREAGGIVIDPAGGPLDIMSRRVLTASTRELADQIIAVLTQYYPQPRDDE